MVDVSASGLEHTYSPSAFLGGGASFFSDDIGEAERRPDQYLRYKQQGDLAYSSGPSQKVDASETAELNELPVGTRLLRNQYEIEKLLDAGGFGITYLARDSLDRQVVIKECFPESQSTSFH